MSASKKATYVLYHFCDGLKFQNWFLDFTKLLTHGCIWILSQPLAWLCGSALTLPTHRYHKNMVYDVIGELFAIDCQDLIQVGCIC
jgi:hypothetical protein